jgi:nicotinate-nucleotide pyrophosphorylase (carboxylating)
MALGRRNGQSAIIVKPGAIGDGIPPLAVGSGLHERFSMRDFNQIQWDEQTIDDCRQLVRLAVREDLGREQDWTTVSLVPHQAQAKANVVARQEGVIAGLSAAALVCQEMNLQAQWQPQASDGDAVTAGKVVATLAGNARDLLTAERTILNFVGRLSGIATLTRRFVEAIAGTKARLYDTRKTAPGWRRLEKYAVRCGGGHNHRAGLCDAVLIKDNHLAFGSQAQSEHFGPAEAVHHARRFLQEMSRPELLLEIELDRLDDFEAVLAAGPDIVLLDNMPPDMLRQAVARRNAAGSPVELEASGGVRLDTARAIAETGVERISCGGLTHSAVNFDVALDWVV